MNYLLTNTTQHLGILYHLKYAINQIHLLLVIFNHCIYVTLRINHYYASELTIVLEESAHELFGEAVPGFPERKSHLLSEITVFPTIKIQIANIVQVVLMNGCQNDSELLVTEFRSYDVQHQSLLRPKLNSSMLCMLLHSIKRFNTSLLIPVRSVSSLNSLI